MGLDGDPVFIEEVMPTHDEIYQKVQATLVDALAKSGLRVGAQSAESRHAFSR